MFVYIYIYIHVCVYICVCIYIYIYPRRPSENLNFAKQGLLIHITLCYKQRYMRTYMLIIRGPLNRDALKIPTITAVWSTGSILNPKVRDTLRKTAHQHVLTLLIYVYIHICIHTCVCIYIYIYMYTHTHTCMYVCIYKYIYIYIYIHISLSMQSEPRTSEIEVGV